jgi:hypothetical protein
MGQSRPKGWIKWARSTRWGRPGRVCQGQDHPTKFPVLRTSCPNPPIFPCPEPFWFCRSLRSRETRTCDFATCALRTCRRWQTIPYSLAERRRALRESRLPPAHAPDHTCVGGGGGGRELARDRTNERRTPAASTGSPRREPPLAETRSANTDPSLDERAPGSNRSHRDHTAPTSNPIATPLGCPPVDWTLATAGNRQGNDRRLRAPRKNMRLARPLRPDSAL